MACIGLDLSKLNRDEFVANADTVWVKAQVLEKVYRLDDEYYTVLEFSDGCFNIFCEDQNGINQALLFFADSVLRATPAGDGGEIISDPSSSSEPNENGAICGIPNLPVFENAINAVDGNAINQFGFQAAARPPNVCAIPIRSNIKIYGPYVSPNFGQCGGTNAESDPDLCPWSFGSAALMNAAGNAKASSYPMNFPPQVETGSITVPEMPKLSLGGSFTGGPNLTSINVSFGSSGITTNYSFQTYTPKANGFTRLFIDRLKNVAKYRQEQIKFLRNNNLDINKINRRLRVINNINAGGNNPRQNARADQNTAQRVLVGEIYDFNPDTSGQRTVVAMTTLSKAIQEMRYDFDKKAYMSLDGLLGPVSTEGGGGLPRYAGYSGLTAQPPCHKASPTLPHPPFGSGEVMDENNPNIARINLNPLTDPGDNEYAGESGDKSGHVIDILGRESGTLEDGVIMNFYHGDKAGDQYTGDYRFLALRGPLVLHAWGFDTNGKPIPNSVDDADAAAQGEFKADELTDQFHKDWLQKPASWPVAPVDLRFDRDRGVWVSPPSYKIVVAKLKEDLDAYGEAKAGIITETDDKKFSRPIYDKNGNEVNSTENDSDAIIKIVDRIGDSYSKDSIVYAYYDTHQCEYLILSGGKPKSEIIRFKLIDICPDMVAPPVDEVWGDNWVSYAGYGDKFFDNNSFTDSYAVRLNCNGEPVDKSGDLLTDIGPGMNKSNLIIVRDVVGKWGPSFNRFTNLDTWTQRAAEGYAVKIPQPSGSGEGSSSSEECDLRTPCLLTYTDYSSNPSGEIKAVDDTYDIVFLESYARFIHGCLVQDLYPVSGEEDKYAGDYWKSNYPSGNALVEIDKFYGNADNGREPYYLDENEAEVQVRVFDPWVSSSGEPISCYDPKQYQFWSAKSGTPIVAAFNETLKRYEIIEIAQKPAAKSVRFRLYGCKQTEATTPDWGDDGDSWTEYAGFFDKIPNDHILGIRIDCDGNPVDRDGKVLESEDISLDNPDKSKIFINLFDTAGKFGPSFAGYKDFNHWKQYASTGFGILCDIPPSGNCTMGTEADCVSIDPEFDSYDITFLESYARYIHGCLKQDLYSTAEQAAIKYADDTWKSAHPSGNAAVEIFKHYGGPDNEQEPKFWDNNINELDLRVFDPWVDANGNPLVVEGEAESCYKPKEGPFYNAKAGTVFIAIFNEKKKRYELVQIGKKEETVIRFKLFDRCSSALAIPNYEQADNWTLEAGYKDKFPNNHILGIRIDCDGNPVDINGKTITNADLNDPNKESDIFVNLYDTAGQWGPAYAVYTGNFNDWKSKAFTGFAAKVSPTPEGCSGLGSNGQCSQPDNSYPSFDIIFLESYARFIHGCLKQDLYPDDSKLSEYSGDTYKAANPSGNAAVASGCIFYGDAPNGKEPKFYDSNGDIMDLRVFDPWLDEVDCYNPKNSKFYSATSGTPFTAIFNEQKKKYYLWTIDEQKSEVVRFRLIDTCYYGSNNLDGVGDSTDPFAAGDSWMEYAGFGDKYTNSHSLAVRINCDGLPLDNGNKIVPEAQLLQAVQNPNDNLAKSIFINVYDTVGRFGPSFNQYTTYGNWVENAATGFGVICNPSISGSCIMNSMGRDNNQCSDISSNYKDNYEIIFLESYARFIECVLDQDLYPITAKLPSYAGDQYKQNHPYGNASATIYDNKFYGDSPNGREPAFLNSELDAVPLRVFDPFFEHATSTSDTNPFYHLSEGDKVLCVFNEKLKKYTIYASLKKYDSEVVKFALVADKGAANETATAILVNQNNVPITVDEREIITTQLAFDDNLIIVRDPFSDGLGNIKSRFGPALGSPNLNDHLNGMNLNAQCYNESIYPFVGFALKREAPIDEYGQKAVVYEIITLEHYATTIRGKVAVVVPDYDVGGVPYYKAIRTYHNDGVIPIARQTNSYGVPNILVDYDVLNFNGAHSYFVGRVVDGDYQCENKVDGCRFKAILDPSASSTDHLIYRVTEAEHLALTGVSVIKKISLANELNAEKINDNTDNEKIESDYFQGFMWSKTKSETIYNDIEILNNPYWMGLPKITTNSRLHTTIVGIQGNGAPIYRIVSADLIALLGVRNLDTVSEPGTFGHASFAEEDRKVDKDTDDYAQGVSPEIIDEDGEKPKWELSPGQEWMTYRNARIFGAWIDRGGPNIKDGLYSIIHAQEAPVIITCLVAEEFLPDQANDIKVSPIEPSSQGYNEEPLNGGGNILQKVRNPMGYGAKVGDHATIQRVWSGVIANGANYDYIVIGTGDPPGALKG